MSVAELIAELQKQPPHKPARVALLDADGYVISTSDVMVKYEGSHVSIEGVTNESLADCEVEWDGAFDAEEEASS